MAVAIVQEWQVQDNTTAVYDGVDEIIMKEGLPQGLIFHCAGFVGDLFRIFDVWESSDDFDRFMKDRLWPALEQVGAADDPPPTVTTYELHNTHQP
jgi:hypothetical protein